MTSPDCFGGWAFRNEMNSKGQMILKNGRMGIDLATGN